MKSQIILTLLITLILLPLVSASDFDVEVLPIKDVITENQIAIFNLVITNERSDSLFEIFSFNTDFIFNGEVIPIASGQTKTKQVRIFPNTEISGLYDVTLFIKKQSTGEIKEVKARIKLVTLHDAIRITTEPELLNVNDKELTFVVRNTANIALNNIRIEAESSLFTDEFSLSLGPKEEKSFNINVDLSDKEGGTHPISVKVYDEGQMAFEEEVPYTLEEIYNFQESRSMTGFLIKEKKLTFINEGNIKEEISIEEPSTILEKIFSYFSEKPLFKTESGAVKATWGLTVEPYSTEEIIVKTNYLLPLIILALIIVGFAFTANYQSRGLVVTKTVVRAKSNRGSAFKVTIKLRNRKDAVRELKIRDFLPQGLNVYEKFDFRKPEKITDKYIEWHLQLLHGGEERVFTYYIYSMEELPRSIVLPNTAVNYLTLHRDPMTEYSSAVKVEAMTKSKA